MLRGNRLRPARTKDCIPRSFSPDKALGFIYLGPGSSVPTGSTMTVQVSARPSSSPTTDVADLVVMEVNDTGHQIVGTVKNTRDHSIQAPTASTCSA